MSRNDVIGRVRSRLSTTTALSFALVLSSQAIGIMEVGAGGGAGP